MLEAIPRSCPDPCQGLGRRGPYRIADNGPRDDRPGFHFASLLTDVRLFINALAKSLAEVRDTAAIR